MVASPCAREDSIVPSHVPSALPSANLESLSFGPWKFFLRSCIQVSERLLTEVDWSSLCNLS